VSDGQPRGYGFRASHPRIGEQQGWIEARDHAQARARLASQGFTDIELGPEATGDPSGGTAAARGAD